MMRPRPTLLYHFTHVDNLRSIIRGGLRSDSGVSASSLAVDVGDQDVKQRRRRRIVPVPPGGVTADYVPFYFAPRSPMMYVISRDGVDGYSSGLEPLVYIVTTPEEVVAAGVDVVISDGNCASMLTAFRSGLGELDDLVDWRVMGARYWRDTDEDGDRKRRRQAEFLVHRHVPWSAVTQLATRSKPMLKRVRAILSGAGLDLSVKHQSDWYY